MFRRYALLSILLLVPTCLFSSHVQISNQYIKITVNNKTGRFVIATTGGDEKLATDQNSLLLYDSNPTNSFTTIRIDGEQVDVLAKGTALCQPETIIALILL